MKNTSKILLWVVLIFGVIVLIALWGGNFAGPERTPVVAPNQTEEVQAIEDNTASLAAKAKLQGDLAAVDGDVDIDSIQTISLEANDWPNSCLGLEGEDELCAQVIVPGYEVTLKLGQIEYTYRTDEEGNIIRQEL